MKKDSLSFFAPQLHIKSGTTNIDFYIKGLGATELRRFTNPDGSIHVSELSLEGALFHLHEENHLKGNLEPIGCRGVTSLVGIFVSDVDQFMGKALKAGATLIHAAQDYDYGYRQGEFRDPFGHHWLIEKKMDGIH